MKRKVIKTGNSLAVTIPSGFAKEVGIRVGDEVEFKTDIDKNQMLIKFLRKPKQIPLFSTRKKTKNE